jgi:hypothetical protein
MGMPLIRIRRDFWMNRLQVWMSSMLDVSAADEPPTIMERSGAGLADEQGARVYLLDPSTGEKIWEVRGDFERVMPVGGSAVLCRRSAGEAKSRSRQWHRGRAKRWWQCA